MSKKGFTLIELIIVVIIIGILAAIAAPMMSANVNKAKRAEAVAALGSLRTAARLYITENSGTVPTALSDLSTYIANADLAGRYYAAGNYSIGSGKLQAADIGFGWANMDINTGVLTQP